MARILFEQYEKTGKVDPSGIISRFESKEEQTLVAELCETRLVENTEGAEARRKEFADSVRNIIAESLDRKKEAAMAAGKGDEMMQYIKQKKDLEKVRRNLME